MSARQRREREKLAEIEGKQARVSGIAKDQCPYALSPWGLGYAWSMGWDYADQKIAAETGQVAKPMFPPQRDADNYIPQ